MPWGKWRAGSRFGSRRHSSESVVKAAKQPAQMHEGGKGANGQYLAATVCFGQRPIRALSQQ